MKSKKIYLLGILVLYHIYLLAQNPADTVTWSIDLADVVVTAQFAPTDNRNAIQDIRVIKRELIERRGVNNLEQLLQQEPSIRIQQDLVLGSSLSLGGLVAKMSKFCSMAYLLLGDKGGISI